VALLGGITLAMPMIVYQVAALRDAGADGPREEVGLPGRLRRHVRLPRGLAFAYFLVLPLALNFLLTFGDPSSRSRLADRALCRLRGPDPAGAGLRLPDAALVMGLAKFRVLSDGEKLRLVALRHRARVRDRGHRDPTIDPVTQTLVGGPIVILYFVGIGLAWLVKR
jgi:sec-independent protein translocase protein TatC